MQLSVPRPIRFLARFTLPASPLVLAFGAAFFTGCQAPAGGVSPAQIMAEQHGMALGTQAAGMVTSLDPTGISGMAVNAMSNQMQEQYHKNLVRRQLSGLPKEQQEIMLRYLESSESMDPDAFSDELLRSYGVDPANLPDDPAASAGADAGLAGE